MMNGDFSLRNIIILFFSSRRRHTRCLSDWSSDVCSSDLTSLDQPVGDQEDAVLGDFVAGDGPLPEEQVELSLRSQALAQALAALGERERQVVERSEERRVGKESRCRAWVGQYN